MTRPSRAFGRIAAVLLALLLAGVTTVALPATRAEAQAAPSSLPWAKQSPASSPAARIRPATAWDPATHQYLLFGGSSGGTIYGDTWVWTGSTWSQLSPASSPSARFSASMVWDPATSQLLLFGGSTGASALNDTWVWTGSTWSQLSPAASPTARSGASIAYSASDRKVVLFGGNDSGGSRLAETWTWNGSTWTQYGGSAPPARVFGAFVGNQTTGRAVLFGGQGTSGVLGDTWTWASGAWTQQSPGTSPTARARAAMTYDPRIGRPVLVGGATASADSQEVWTWTGTNWSQATTSGAPPARDSASLGFFPPTADLVLFGGSDYAATFYNETWTSDVSPATALGFSQVASTGPPARTGAAMAYDDATGQLVLFGGYSTSNANLGDTWTWDGSAWTQRSPANSPSARFGAAMAYDPATGQLILFGGQGGSYFQDTWNWDGSNWNQVATGGPSTRVRAAIGFAYGTGPSGEGQLVLYGGSNGTVQNDTFLWNGTAWAAPTAAQSANPSAARQGATMAWDAATAQLLMFGGTNSGSYNAQTYQWTSSGWSLLATGSASLQRSQAPMAFDDATGQMLIYSGMRGGSALGDLWSWDGTTWTQITTATLPTQNAANMPMSFDPLSGRLLFFSGRDVSSTLATQNTWVWDYQPQALAGSTLALSAALTGYDRSSSVLQSVQVNTPTGSGWSITVQADQAPKNGARTLTSPAGSGQPTTFTVNGSAASATASTVPAVSCLDTGCTAPSPTGAVTYPVAVPTSSAAVVYRAAAASGIGRNVVNLRLWSTIRADSYSGTYTNTLTITTGYGP